MNIEREITLELVENIGTEPIESLHLVCGTCFAADPHTPTLCGILDESAYEEKDYQNCVVCFDMLENQFCPRGHMLDRRS